MIKAQVKFHTSILLLAHEGGGDYTRGEGRESLVYMIDLMAIKHYKLSGPLDLISEKGNVVK